MGEAANKHLKGTEWNIKMFTINGGRKEEQRVIHSLNTKHNKAAFSDYHTCSPSFITTICFSSFESRGWQFTLLHEKKKKNNHLHMPDLVN